MSQGEGREESWKSFKTNFVFEHFVKRDAR